MPNASIHCFVRRFRASAKAILATVILTGASVATYWLAAGERFGGEKGVEVEWPYLEPEPAAATQASMASGESVSR